MSVNRVILVGHVGADPVIRYMPDGTPTATLSLATNEFWKDKSSGEKKERTEWHNLVAFRALADKVIQPYVKKGQEIYIEGRLRTRKWQDKNAGVDRYTTEVIIDELQMLGRKKQADELPPAPAGGDAAPIEDSDVPF